MPNLQSFLDLMDDMQVIYFEITLKRQQQQQHNQGGGGGPQQQQQQEQEQKKKTTEEMSLVEKAEAELEEMKSEVYEWMLGGNMAWECALE